MLLYSEVLCSMVWRHYQDFQSAFELGEFFNEAGEFNVQQTTRWKNNHIRNMQYRCTDFRKTGCSFVIRVEYPRPSDDGDEAQASSWRNRRSIQVYLRGDHKESCINSFAGEDRDSCIFEDVPSAPEQGLSCSSVVYPNPVVPFRIQKETSKDFSVSAVNSVSVKEERNRQIRVPKRFTNEKQNDDSPKRKYRKKSNSTKASEKKDELWMVKSSKAIKLKWAFMEVLETEAALHKLLKEDNKFWVDYTKPTGGLDVRYRCSGYRARSNPTHCGYHLRVTQERENGPYQLFSSGTHCARCPNFRDKMKKDGAELGKSSEKDEDLSAEDKAVLNLIPPTPPAILSLEGSQRKLDEKVDDSPTERKLARVDRKREGSSAEHFSLLKVFHTESELKKFLSRKKYLVKREKFWRNSYQHEALWYRCAESDCPFQLAVFFPNPVSASSGSIKVHAKGRHKPLCQKKRKKEDVVCLGEKPPEPIVNSDKDGHFCGSHSLSTPIREVCSDRSGWKPLRDFSRKSDLNGFLSSYGVTEIKRFYHLDGSKRRAFLKCKNNCSLEVSVQFPPARSNAGRFRVTVCSREEHERTCLRWGTDLSSESKPAASESRSKRQISLPGQVESTIGMCLRKMADNGFSIPATFVAGIARIAAKKLKGASFFKFPGYAGPWLDNFCERNGLEDLKENRGTHTDEKQAQEIMEFIERTEIGDI